MKISNDVLEVLNRCEIDSASVVLPEGQLDRKLYLKVDKVLKAAGGKWVRRAKAHLFTRDPREALGLAVEEGSIVDPKKDLQAFYTPHRLAVLLAYTARLEPGMKVLEPSVGAGALAKACLEVEPGVRLVSYDVDRQACIELLKELKGLAVKISDVDAMNQDFLDVPSFPVDRVVMNPPFSKGQDVAHVTHALAFLEPGGWLSTILPAGTCETRDRPKKRRAFWDLVEAQSYHKVYGVPDNAFASSGTRVRTKILVIRKGKA